MSFIKILMVIIILIIINLLLNKIIKILDKKKNKKIYKENKKLNFEILAKKYIENLGYNDFLQDNMDNINICEKENLILVCYKDLNNEDIKLKRKLIMAFVSKVFSKKASKGIFIYDGKIPNDIENIINKNKSLDFTIEFINKEKILLNINSSI